MSRSHDRDRRLRRLEELAGADVPPGITDLAVHVSHVRLTAAEAHAIAEAERGRPRHGPPESQTDLALVVLEVV